ncbi:hypothetical protein BgAZ_101440 [Babesia gibsoni]|uniref:Uncharacterized protein n=1 Tax=Babesia gibsoni TaxID=33632 RepID=A0AAD8UUU6_BABGI|nr:hypothetical protein BgAZ_101440 [Babesia gibsoni]
MSKLFDNVRRYEDDDGAISAELGNIGSSIAGISWHRESLGGIVRTDEGSGDAEFTASPTPTKEGDDMLEHIKLLMENERKEKDRIRQLLEKERKLSIDKKSKHVEVNRNVSTMKLLEIATAISGRQPAQAKPQQDEQRMRRENAYYRNINRNRLNVPLEVNGYYRNKRSSTTELVRVLDVDALPLPMIHHMVCYAMVKHMPAETVIKVISRVAMLRDKDNHVAYQNFLRDVGKVASPMCRAEIVALLSRCYQSISVPFMVDYVRRYGTFSRRFMAKLIQTHSQPLPLDFMRYKAGQRTINQLLTRPWALFGYVKMLKKSSSKTYMYHNLLARGYVPDENEFDRFHSFGTLDSNMATTILNSEKLLNSTLEVDRQDSRVDPNRPEMYEEVLEAQTLGIPLEDIHDESVCVEESISAAPSSVGAQMVKIQTDLPQPRTRETTCGIKDVEENLPVDKSNITWDTPWGRKRDEFHFRGKTYALDAEHGWRIRKSPVRLHYLKNVKMNQRKRERKALRAKASKLARRALASHIDNAQN